MSFWHRSECGSNAILPNILNSRALSFTAYAAKTAAPKKELGLKQVKPELEHEAMCNPKFQAKFLAEKGVELYISCGLCVGHDAIFNMNAEGPVTNLVVKDRLLAHNPLGAIYSRYWKRKLGIMDDGEV